MDTCTPIRVFLPDHLGGGFVTLKCDLEITADLIKCMALTQASSRRGRRMSLTVTPADFELAAAVDADWHFADDTRMSGYEAVYLVPTKPPVSVEVQGLVSVHGTYLVEAEGGKLRGIAGLLATNTQWTITHSSATKALLLRESGGKYLASDSYGEVFLSALDTIVWGQAHWTVEDGCYLKSAYDLFLVVRPDGKTETVQKSEANENHWGSLSIAEGNTVTKGYLKKKMHKSISVGRKFQDRYFVVSGTQLSYYHTQAHYEAQVKRSVQTSSTKRSSISMPGLPTTKKRASILGHTFPLTNAQVVPDLTSPCRFTLVLNAHGVPDLVLIAPTPAQCQQWMQRVRQAKMRPSGTLGELVELKFNAPDHFDDNEDQGLRRHQPRSMNQGNVDPTSPGIGDPTSPTSTSTSTTTTTRRRGSSKAPPITTTTFDRSTEGIHAPPITTQTFDFRGSPPGSPSSLDILPMLPPSPAPVPAPSPRKQRQNRSQTLTLQPARTPPRHRRNTAVTIQALQKKDHDLILLDQALNRPDIPLPSNLEALEALSEEAMQALVERMRKECEVLRSANDAADTAISTKTQRSQSLWAELDGEIGSSQSALQRAIASLSLQSKGLQHQVDTLTSMVNGASGIFDVEADEDDTDDEGYVVVVLD